MGNLLSTLDLVVFFGSLVVIMGVGLWAGRKEDTADDYYLAGRSTKWWGVAGSIFGSNVSANHMVGMMGVGFAVGFAQSHFEITAIAGLLALCYLFLPMYRKLRVYTLSEYLSRRYNDASRLAYALIMVIIMVVILMVPGFYIGSRSILILLQGDQGQPAAAQAVVDDEGQVTAVRIANSGQMYGEQPAIKLAPPQANAPGGKPATAEAIVADAPLLAVVVKDSGEGYDPRNPPTVEFSGGDPEEPAAAVAVVTPAGRIASIQFTSAGSGYDSAPNVNVATPAEGGRPAEVFSAVSDRGVTRIRMIDGGAGYTKAPGVAFAGGALDNAELSPGDVNPTWYIIGILAMAVVTGTYTIFGGLKAVIVTDVIQSVLLLAAGILVAVITFHEFGGWREMIARDMDQAVDVQRMHLYNPSDDVELPWSGVLTGLMVLHFYYWGSNQFIVQRALSAKTDRQARFGIIAAGFFKLLIPFFSVCTGVAAWYLYADQGEIVAQDAVFTTLLADLIAPIGYGLVGLVAAGMIGAILSSLDSMMNSAATIFTFDIYKRFIRPDASEAHVIGVGRICVVVFIALAALLAIFTMDPNSKESFFLRIASHQSRLVAGVVVAFVLGMLWKRACGVGGFLAIVMGVALSYGVEPLYTYLVQTNAEFARAMVPIFGEQMNFLHSVFIAAIGSLILHVLLSLLFPARADQSELTWTGQGIFQPSTVAKGALLLAISLALYGGLGVAVWLETLAPVAAGAIAGVWTFALFLTATIRFTGAGEDGSAAPPLLARDGFWGGVLAGVAIFMLYFFY
jgi:SSS family solute:Na+ symporter